MVKYLVILVFLFDAYALAQKDCKDFFNSSSLNSVKAQYKKLLELPFIWKNYRPENYTTVLTNTEDSFGHCAVIIDPSQNIVEVPMANTFTFTNGLYNFYLGNQSLAGSVPVELDNFLKKKKISTALIYNVIKFPESKDIPDYIAHLSGRDDFHLNVIVHEGFHLNIKFANLSGDKTNPWPTWDLQPERDIGKNCYSNEIAKPFWEKEKNALNAFVKILLLDRSNLKLAITAARDFIKIRKQRYESLKDIRVPSKFNPNGISCSEAESIMELEEGMADYLGTTASLVIGSMSPLQVIEHLSDYHDWYYRSGLAQLLFIYKLAPEKALEITGKISNASIWENGVFNQFENYINQNSF